MNSTTLKSINLHSIRRRHGNIEVRVARPSLHDLSGGTYVAGEHHGLLIVAPDTFALRLVAKALVEAADRADGLTES